MSPSDYEKKFRALVKEVTITGATNILIVPGHELVPVFSVDMTKKEAIGLAAYIDNQFGYIDYQGRAFTVDNTSSDFQIRKI